MNTVVMQNGKRISDLSQLQNGEVVHVYESHTVEDLPVNVLLATGVSVPREVFVEMLRTFAKSEKMRAIKWLRTLTGWGLASAKWFVDSLDPPTKRKELTQKDIENWIQNEAVFKRGEEYYQDDRIYNQTKTISHSFTSLRAKCTGTNITYSVGVDLNEGGEIISSHCTCPYKRGHCKHVAALLLEWVNYPEGFD